ncbi:MAG: TetR/AcrR family transcriptional regulator [Ignavibacteria bacterium]|nr:TetR/AcrR family transcriptional regulator [Ignavibacteria bacterium]
MKEKILQYSKEVFYREGFYKITMDELASGMKISKKTIYKYFPSKESIINELIEETLQRVNIAHDEILQRDINSLEKLVAVGKFIINDILSINNKMLNDLKQHTPHLWIKIDKFRKERLLKNFSIILDQGKNEGFIKEIPNQIITTVFISGARAVINPDFILNNNLSIGEAGKSALMFLISGMLTKKGQEVFNKITMDF